MYAVYLIPLIITIVAAGLIFPEIIYACTVWASIGSVNKHGGTIIAKNRDEDPKFVQKVIDVQPKKGFRFLALAYKLGLDHDGYKFFSAGINEKGLVMVNTNATCDYKTHDNQLGGTIEDNILARYATVAEVLRDQEKLFTHGEPINLLFGDREQIAVVEIAANGKYHVQQRSEGILWHSNHYIAPEFESFNKNIDENTVIRYQRIHELLNDSSEKYTAELFSAFAQDQHNGPKNSILRQWTVATWIVDMPPNAPPKLFVKLFNPNQPKETDTIVLDQHFWKEDGADS